MSNPFLINVPTITNYSNPPIQILNNPPPHIPNYSINQTSLNNNSTYFSSNNNNAVSSINNLNGAVTISSTTPNLTVTEVGNDIQLAVQSVSSVNNLAGAVTISSTNGNLTVTENNNNIELTVLAGGIGVESLENLAGNIALTSTGNTVAITTVGQNINFEAVAPPLAGVTSLNSLTGGVNITSTGGTVGITTNGQNVNLEALGITPVSDWANFPAVNSVNLPDKDFNMTSSTAGIAYNKATINANVDIGNLTNAPSRPDFNAYCGTVTLGGITTPLTAMNINSIGPVGINSGLGVSIAGGGGVAVTGGGAVTVNSVGGVLVDGGGAISINGAGGISIVGGGALSIASGGILVSAGGVAVNGGGVAINAGGLNVLAGATAIGSAGLAGGGLNVYGSDLSLLPVGPFTSSLKTDLITSQSGTPTLAISNVATINGSPYPPSGSGGVSSINGLTGIITLTAGTNISLVPVGNNITINQINVPVTNRASGTTPLLITATTFATAQTIANLSLTTSSIYDINVFSVSVLQTTTNTNRDMNLFVTINGVQVGQVFTSTIGGIGHFLSMPQQCTLISAIAGTQTILLKGFASSAGDISVNSYQISAIGNLA